MITFIWAQTKDGIIAKDGKTPWHLPEEMNFFKERTMDHTVVMGRKTFDSMNDRPLKGRMNYVLTDNVEEWEKKYAGVENVKFIKNIQPLVEQYSDRDGEELYVLGGNETFKQFLPSVQSLVRTTIKKDYDGDTKMIDINYNDFIRVAVKNNPDFVVDTYIKKGVFKDEEF